MIYVVLVYRHLLPLIIVFVNKPGRYREVHLAFYDEGELFYLPIEGTVDLMRSRWAAKPKRDEDPFVGLLSSNLFFADISRWEKEISKV